MDERLRRQYLAAMDIPLWVPRDEAELPAAAAVAEPADAPPRRHSPDSPRAATAALEHSAPTPPPLTEPAPAQPLASNDAAHLDWDALMACVSSCAACAQLVSNRSRTVFGVGNRSAELMVIGEAPGVDEDRQGEPFVGRAGQLLNRMLQAVGFAREQVFIANVLKCRPPNNRDPHADEAARCEPFLQRQVELVAPKAILCVGRIAAQNLLKTDAPLGLLRKGLHFFGEQRIPVVVTYHPAYLLRSPQEKAKAWIDLQRALRVLRGQEA